MERVQPPVATKGPFGFCCSIPRSSHLRFWCGDYRYVIEKGQLINSAESVQTEWRVSCLIILSPDDTTHPLIVNAVNALNHNHCTLEGKFIIRGRRFFLNYFESQGDFVITLITPISHITTFPLLTYLLSHPD